jgi:hypothetical protein
VVKCCVDGNRDAELPRVGAGIEVGYWECEDAGEGMDTFGMLGLRGIGEVGIDGIERG